jgi:predicted nucleotide-binding protein
MAELDQLKEKLSSKLNVQSRQLSRLIQQKEGQTLLPRRLATLALAAENNIPISKYASEDDLLQLRAVQGNANASRSDHADSPVRTLSSRRRVEPKKRPPPRKQTGMKKSAVGTTTIHAKPKPATRGRTVFVVHGRNESLRRSLFTFLRSLDLDPLEWSKAISATGKTNPTIPEILNVAFERAVAVVVLLSPDDEVQLRDEFRKPSDPSYENRPVGQARPNVLFEAGMAMGRNSDATVLVQVGDVKPFSDVSGLHITRLGNDPESRSEVVTKLRNAGCAVNQEGTDWYSEGEFE